MLDIIKRQLENQLLSGGIILVIFGALLTLLRRVPFHLLGLLRRKLVIAVDVSDQDPAFYWILAWLAKHPYSQRSALLTVTTSNAEPDAAPTQHKPEVLFSPAPGAHLLRFEKRWLLLTRRRTEMTSGVGFSDRFWRECLSIQMLGRDRSLLRRLVLEAQEHAQAPDTQVNVLTWNRRGWSVTRRCRSRKLDSVFLPDDVANELHHELTTFFACGSWYHEKGIPYRMGYLLQGPPGSGKTSLALALASHFRRDLFLLRPIGIGDDELCEMMSALPQHAIVLVEDIDCFFEGRKSVGSGAPDTFSFSSFLNAIDGVTAPEGRLLLLTTNHPELLDPALVRPGRIDRQITFSSASGDQARRLCLRFFPQREALATTFAAKYGGRGLSMADLQGHLLRHRDAPEEAA